MLRLLIIQGQAFADFTCSDPDDVLIVGIVIGALVEDAVTDYALPQFVGLAFQGLLNDVLQQRWTSFALVEVRTVQQPVQFVVDAGSFRLRIAEICCRMRRLLHNLPTSTMHKFR